MIIFACEQKKIFACGNTSLHSFGLLSGIAPFSRSADLLQYFVMHRHFYSAYQQGAEEGTSHSAFV